ncbi:hypothetical protein C8Q72DRAFT_490048 [Fomitopsis betulina]|nr:hypothetical protein C8Q72DRAFT_490048 [Fomitopsis betulina]
MAWQWDHTSLFLLLGAIPCLTSLPEWAVAVGKASTQLPRDFCARDRGGLAGAWTTHTLLQSLRIPGSTSSAVQCHERGTHWCGRLELHGCSCCNMAEVEGVV